MAKADYVVDTNILINANGDKSEQTSPECKAACVQLLFKIMATGHRIVIDGGIDQSKSLILAEYYNNLRSNGSGLGEMFLQWILSSWANEYQVVHVPITPKDESFEEFPSDKRLKDFDPRDRKWIATARSHHMFNDVQAKIAQSADMKWKLYSSIFSELDEYPVEIEFICDEKK